MSKDEKITEIPDRNSLEFVPFDLLEAEKGRLIDKAIEVAKEAGKRSRQAKKTKALNFLK